jgi:pyruvate,water dikinase
MDFPKEKHYSEVARREYFAGFLFGRSMDTVKGPTQELSQPHTSTDTCEPRHDREPISALIDSIASQFELAMDRAEHVEAECARLRQALDACPVSSRLQRLTRLLPLLRKKTGAMSAPVFSLLEETALACDDPWPLLEGMLVARDRTLISRALELAVRCAQSGSLAVGPGAVQFLADQIEQEDSALADPPALHHLATILRKCLVAAQDDLDPLLTLFMAEGNTRVCRLAARLLDLDGHPASPQLSKNILGSESYAFLRPYLDYTQAGHLDLLHLAPSRGCSPPVLPSLRHAAEICGETLLKKVIAELGWERVNLGVEVTQCIGISIGGSFPLVVSPAEATLFETSEEAHRTFERFLIVAHGGLPTEEREQSGGDSVARFRSYNLLHAEALADILDVAPLTREKVRRILGRMDQIVQDFTALFSSCTTETTILPSVYQELKQRVLSELKKETSEHQLSAELTRLVQTFHDPRSLGAVRTLHGLKRYLHQKGLQLGIRLVETGGATNRTIDLAVATRRRILRTMKKIRYVDFEPEIEGAGTAAAIPYPVAAAVNAFGRLLLHGQEKFPGVRIFCYGNEVHYYLSFVNHPAFLRIDYSPPLQGGMIDLEYYGVSKYELSAHPNPNLDAIRLFFQRLEFDVRVENTRIHARYDKERALDLRTLCKKAEALLALVPYLMEVDWVVGNLRLDAEARQKVGEAWAEKFALWGVLPISQLLTKDRQGILMAVETGAAGEHEVVWAGRDSYCDRFTTSVPADFFIRLRRRLEELGIDAAQLEPEGRQRSFGQVCLERSVLRPVREACARGELVAGPEGFCRSALEFFQAEHEAEKFAEILDSGDEATSAASTVANLIAPLERSLRFVTTGSLNGCEVQRAHLALRGDSLSLYVLRDRSGGSRLGMFVHGETLFRHRENPNDTWQSNGNYGAVELAAMLRRNNYLASAVEASIEAARSQSQGIRESFRRESGTWRSTPQPGEQIVTGLKASPGRAVGTALFGTGGRSPKDFVGAVMVSPFVRPEDSTFLFHSSGVVSTGGGVLSHAGLIAIQFRKPALIISGQWQRETDGSMTLLFRTLEYREETREVRGWRVSVRKDMRECEHRLREGDLVVLDAGEGTLCVLGQSRETLTLHEGFQLFGEASRHLARATDAREVLVLRGWRLRALHQIEKLLGRLTDPVLAKHAVYELLLGKTFAGEAGSLGEKERLLSLLLNNRQVGLIAREHLVHLGQEIARRHQFLCDRAEQRIPTSTSACEILTLRLEALRLRQTLVESAISLEGCKVGIFRWDPGEASKIESDARRRLDRLRAGLANALRSQRAVGEKDFRSRHLLRQLERLDMVLGLPQKEEQEALESDRNRIERQDANAIQRMQHRLVLEPEDGGFGVFPLIGWKAANLAEVGRLSDHSLVPPWFVVTNKAFEGMLDLPLERNLAVLEGILTGGATLREAIHAILSRSDIDHAQKSAHIRGLWTKMTLPHEMADEVVSAYRKLGEKAGACSNSEEDHSRPFVAIRSSAREEDAEIAARAGEFETFLFVRGEDSLLEHLKRAWSGLWTERAIHNRSVLGTGSEHVGGGVIVQRMVWSRVSGVLQTVNVAEGELRGMVVNAGLGLGEGVVSGVVAADQIVVDKESDLEKGPLRFRYITSDKREQVIFSKRTGQGTMRAESLYHQRLRPALEYVELSELVRTAAVLESAYGYPLDMEFGLEGTRLWILQVRPVAIFLSTLRETVERYPLS